MRTAAANAAVDPRHPNHQILRGLRLRWAITALVYAGTLAGGYWLLRDVWQPHHAAGWLLWAGLLAAVELAILWWILRHNHPPDSPTLRTGFGYGTALTLLCGLLLALVAGFLFAPRPSGWLAWMPALLYTAARLVDYIDGYVARITHYETKLGGILDMEFDGLGILVAIALAIQYGTLPLWYLPLALARQIFIAGIWWRERRGLPVYDMTPSAARRIIAGFQTGFVSVMLWPVFAPPLTTLAAVMFALPLALSFLRDWGVVSGALDPAAAGYQRARAAAKTLIEGWLPLLCRVAGTGLAVIILWVELPDFAAWQPWLAQNGIANPRGLLWVWSAIFVLALLPYLLGIVGRVAALALIGLACLDISAAGLDWSDNAWLLIATIVVAHAGSGRWAMWAPEDPILHRRPGDTHDIPL
jgi:CDP-diacylglycerol--glycerol-3-phosphate 3-phosphatidyltransferase